MALLGKGRLKEAVEFATDLADRIRDRRETLGVSTQTAAAQVLKEDEVIKARLDGEKWYNNRLIVGPLATLLGWILDTTLPEARITITEDMIVGFGPLIEAIGLLVTGAGGALAKWLKPINWKRPWTIFGIGR